MRWLVVLVGATASGKTSVAIQLAKQLGCEIVSADSRQVYKELRIGSAAPREEELQQVPHHLVHCHTVIERYSAGQYEEEALATIESLHKHYNVVLLVGGSMLYVDAVCKGLDYFPPPDLSLRARLNAQLRTEGVETLAHRLRTLDPEGWHRIDVCNGARVVRALEVTLQSGIPYSAFLTQQRVQRPFGIIKIGLKREWDELCTRIETRVDAMLELGLVTEVKNLHHYWHLPALRTVGYRELFPYIEGTGTLAEARDAIVVHTRRYAKQQRNWWRRDEAIVWFSPHDICGMVEYIGNAMEKE